MTTVSYALIITAVLLGSIASGCGPSLRAQESAGPPLGRSNKPPVKLIRVGDIDVEYRVYGQGDPLVLIMGFGGTIDTWSPEMLELLSRTYQVIVFDNRGTGGTGEGTAPFSMEQFADDTAGLMDALQIPRAHVLGWSMGAEIAQELALRHPDKVDRLILYAPDPGGAEAIQPSGEVVKQLTDPSGTERERGERFVRLLVPADWLASHADYFGRIFSGPMEAARPESAARQAEAIEKWTGSYSRLPTLKSPTLLLTGTDDVIAPPANSLIMVRQIPWAWLVQLEDGGHGVQYQYPDTISRLVQDFIRPPR